MIAYFHRHCAESTVSVKKAALEKGLKMTFVQYHISILKYEGPYFLAE